MSEWMKVKLGDVAARVCSGGTPRSNCSEYYEGGDIPWLNTKEVHSNRIYATEKCITQLGLENSSAKWISANSVIVAMYGATAGNVAQTRIPLTTNQACCNLEINESLASADFVFYFLRNRYSDLLLLSNGAAQQNLNAQVIRDFEISLPPLPTQRKIAAVLSALDDKIENNRKICANLEAQAQAIFKSWFVDFEPFGGKMPEGWKMGKLGDVVESMLNGDWGKDTPDGKNDSPVYCIRGADIPDVVCGSKGKMPLRYILPKNYEAKQLSNGDVVIEISGGSPTQSTGRAALITGSLLERYDRGMVCTNFCKAVKPRNGFSFLFYNYWRYLYDKGVFFQYENGTTGIKNLGIGTVLNELNIVVPEAGALDKFTDIVSENFNLTCKLGLENEKLAALRDALLPKLMSGEIDVEKVKVA